MSERDRPDTDVVLTPQMIEAGVEALRACIADDDARIFADQEIVSRVVRATLESRLRD